MGRSGVAIADAAVKQGAIVTVYDQHLSDDARAAAIVDRLHGLGASVVTGWHGHLENDFDILVTSPGFHRHHPSIMDAQRFGKEIISEIEFAYRISRAPIVAITGTNGKSTTTVLAWMLLNAARSDGGFTAAPFEDSVQSPLRLPAILCGNISGTGYPEATLTEAAAVALDNQVLVAEVSSFQLEWVSRFKPIAAAITNVTPDHGDRHPSFADYKQTKVRIFGAMGESDIAVFNESERSLKMEDILSSVPRGVGIRSFSLNFEGSGKCQPTTYRDGGILSYSGRLIEMSQLALGGEHNVTNSLMAWELACAALPPLTDAMADRMLTSLAQFRGLAHRMEFVGERNGVCVYNNSMCTNPQAVMTSVDSLTMRQHLLMGGNMKNVDYGALRAYLQQSSHRVYLFGNPSESQELAAVLGADWPVFSSLRSAFCNAIEFAGSGEAIVLSPGCRSSYPYADFRERGDDFRRMAKEWINE